VAISRLSLTANEERITSEDSAVVAILEQKADTILSMTRCVQSFHFDVLADSESLAMAWRGGDLLAILATNDGERVAFEDLGIAAGVIMVAER
jgi:hypothetical protein